MSAVALSPTPARRWLAPEVVQTSAMDCGPATLKCVLEGFGVPVSYGRLREACQTDVDGTSIDTLEVVAQQLGVVAEQVMIPPDHVLLPHSPQHGAQPASVLPAIAVVRHGSGATHFVVVWRRLGNWLQVMDPASGRRWLRCEQFAQELFGHEMPVAASDWRDWAASDEFCEPLRARLRFLGADADTRQRLIQTAASDRSWFGFASLDASVRLVNSLVQARGLAPGAAACHFVQTVFDQARAAPGLPYSVITAAYWSVGSVGSVGPAAPALPPADAHALSDASAPAALSLRLRGAVLLRLRARAAGELGSSTQDGQQAGSHAHTNISTPAGTHVGTHVGAHSSTTSGTPPMSPELRAALSERQPHPLRTVWGLLRQDGLLGPVALVGAMALAAGALVMQTLLFRGLFDVGAQLGLAQQRLLAVLALLVFVGLLLALEVPIVAESLRYGRHLELRLRLALLAKLPRLNDRYFQSRSVSDMAERSHNIQQARNVPMLGLNLVQSLAELLLTLLGVALLAPASTGWALATVAAAILVPTALQPWLNERDLRVRNHAAALNGFYLDALLGLVPVRSQNAERVVARQHESLLVEWLRASRSLNGLSISASSLQTGLCMALAVGLLLDHFLRARSVVGGDLLLVYWALKLPSLGGGVGSLARQYPAQRNVLMRLFEPLTAPEDVAAVAAAAPAPAPAPHEPAAGLTIHIENGSVLAAGHEILRDIHLHIAAGEHIAIVGASGAGKSSLVGLLLGWHRLAQGRLEVDGATLDAAAQNRLRRCTAWVDPGVQLWNQSFVDNLLYASSEHAVARVGPVIAAAGLRGVLQKLPQGLQTPLGEGGALLSGGEGQRVRLGRAMLQSGVRLALLDEPFRGLDRAQRRALLTQTRAWWCDATLLCVTHDVGETTGFARVLVVENGRIVEDGAPTQLSTQDTRYAAMLRAEKDVLQQTWCMNGNGDSDRAGDSERGSNVDSHIRSHSQLDGSAHTAGWRHLQVEAGGLVTRGAKP
jgi:ABC-type bacteriocin/lantibiotic exporter with double-glycine peptidase domain